VLRILYTFLWIVGLPFVLFRLLWRSRREPGYRRHVLQRLGIFQGTTQSSVLWIHAVSVGETRAAQPLIARLQAQFPDRPILLTQTTATGRETAEALFGSTVIYAWLPWDLPWTQRAFLRAWRPMVCILMETELWPNLLTACTHARIPVALVNARLSERSARRYAHVQGVATAMLGALDLIAAQTAADAGRFKTLGARSVVVTGNLKFDLDVPEAQRTLAAQWRAQLGSRRIVLLASTREGEEAQLVSALQRLLDEDVLIALVPRHPQRFSELAGWLEESRLNTVRRSTGHVPGGDTRVWLGDSMGEMLAWYALADVAVIGGSWRPLGGQNLIEACAMACPVIVGPHTFNFQQATDDAVAAGAAIQVANASEMARTVAGLLADTERCQHMALAGQAFAAAHRGATGRLMSWLEPLLPGDAAQAPPDHRIDRQGNR
jgi:3-deoxy-D-manno-octulosonic-acid transferase